MWVLMRPALHGIMSQVFLGTGPAGETLFNGSLGLFAAPFNPGVNSVLGDLTEATFDGYARIGLQPGWGTLFTGQSGLEYIANAEIQWQPTGDTTFNIIYGQFIVGSDSVTLLAAEVFDSPIPLNSSANAFTDVPRLGLDPAANYGLSVVAV